MIGSHSFIPILANQRDLFAEFAINAVLSRQECEMCNKLYRVTCRGMQGSHGTAYVIAGNPNEAYRLLRDDLDRRDLGFQKERELLSVELIAEEGAYPDCKTQLYGDF